LCLREGPFLDTIDASEEAGHANTLIECLAHLWRKPASYVEDMIKATPEDFVVEERADLPLRQHGGYRVYLLKKSHWNTLDLIHHLAKTLNQPADRFSYGGKKDKHGLTSQFITIMNARDFSTEGKGFSLESRGFMDRPMGPDIIQGNAFTVTIRDLVDIGPLETNLEEVKKSGFPNFFDDQRFRSYDQEHGFFAEKVLKRHWNGALQVFLTSAGPDDSGSERERKAALFKNWKDWPLLLTLASGPLEMGIFGFLNGRPNDAGRALHQIPEEEVSMQYAAYQSHLWNELLRRLIKRKVRSPEEVPGREGGYLFWHDLSTEILVYLGSLEIPTAAAKMDFADDLTRSLLEDILKEKSLTLSLFRTKALRKVYFRSFQRRALVIPKDLQALGVGNDELHPGKKKWTISFVLPRGSYGTMLIKRLALKPDKG
jgi:tRNA pseudouridine13 synthase